MLINNMINALSNNMRNVKFETLIKDVNEAANINDSVLDLMSKVSINTLSILGYTNSIGQKKRCSNPSMLLIYDYDKLNDYGKIILEQSSLYLTDWDSKYTLVESLKDIKTKINAAKELIGYLRMDYKRKEAYKFVFWAMMVLTVDKTDKDEKLSLICDFARMLKITDDEMEDMVMVIKVLYHEEEEGFKFKTEMVPSVFSRVLCLYNN